MKVLITGITGFIGSELARKLLKDGDFEIAGLLRTSSNQKRVDAIDDIINNIRVFYANFNDHHAIRNVIKTFRPNYILHIGAQTAVRDSFEMPHEFNETNYLGTINLIHAALEVADFKKFIFASTMEVYGFQKARKPFREDLPLNPGSPYAASKAACEHYLRMANQAFGLPYLISRACNTYGRKHNSGYIVEHIITSMLDRKKVYIGTPKAVRDLMHVDDHVNAYVTLLKSNVVNETFNFGTGSGLTMLELANIIKKRLGYKDKIIARFPSWYLFRPLAEEYLSIDSLKAKKILGWEPRISLDKGLISTIAYWKKVKK
ncbi:MAG: GDP-mannose 4,6-dehydratase [Candidatus Yanofskybacteria bacterium]|nr:GDP-mannose 4,6-dehydratase [Candidatus Yanofskybacteria bacterium]